MLWSWTSWMYSQYLGMVRWHVSGRKRQKMDQVVNSSGGRCQPVYPSGKSFCERNKIIQCSSQQSFVFDPYPHPQIDHKSIHNYPTSAWFSSHSAFVSVARPNTHAKWVWTLDKWYLDWNLSAALDSRVNSGGSCFFFSHRGRQIWVARSPDPQRPAKTTPKL